MQFLDRGRDVRFDGKSDKCASVHDHHEAVTSIKVVSGGQTGVDRAALDAAESVGLGIGGWCPSGRRSEDGCIPAAYPLDETPSTDYPQRTAWNVRDSDGTLVVLTGRELTGGTLLTSGWADRLGRPLLVVDLNEDPREQDVITWVITNRITVLNVAGPRESEQPGIYGRAGSFLKSVFRAIVEELSDDQLTDT